MIHLDALTVRYGDFRAVDGLSLHIRPGELFGLLGPNGAGKSSTLRVLIGQRKPSGGSVRVAGKDVVREWDAVKPLFGYVPDRENHFEEFTGRRNLRLFADLYGVPRSRIDDCLAMVEMSEAADLPVGGYSLGMRRKLMLARALLHDPPVMYLDEPTSNLDIHSVQVVHKLLRERVKAGKTVVLTTHDMGEVEAICDRVAIICRGKLVALDSPLALKTAHTEAAADVVTHAGERLSFSLADAAGREALAEVIRRGDAATVRTREFDFHATFLKLTGRAFE